MARPTISDDNALGWGPVLRAAIFDVSDRADGQTPSSVRTGGGTLAVAEAGCIVVMNVATGHDLFVPPDTFAPTQSLTVIQYGPGLTTLRQGTGVNIRIEGKTAPYPLAGQYAWVTLWWLTANEVLASGALA